MSKCKITDKIYIKKHTRKLINKQQLNKKNTRLNGEKPIAVLTVGGIGVGKSTSLKILAPKLFPKIDFVTINGDIINESIFDGSGDCRDETNQINNTFLEMAIKNKKNLLFDSNGSNYDFFMKKIRELHEYQITVIIILADPEIAADRAANRFATGESNRSDSRQKILNIHKRIKNVIEKYVRIPAQIVHNIYVYDNNNKLKLILFRNPNGLYKCAKSAAKWFPNLYKTRKN